MTVPDETSPAIRSSSRIPVPSGATRAPALVASAAFCGLSAITAAIARSQSDLSTGTLTVLGAYGVVVATLVAVLAARWTRRYVDQQAASARLAASNLEHTERLRLMVASLHEGLIYQDRHLRIVEFNVAATEILGLGESALGLRPEELGPWHPVLEDGTELDFADHPAAVTLRTGEPIVGMTLGVAFQSGGVIWVKATTIPVFDESGAADGVITTFTDITPERTVRLALASSEAAVNEATEALSWQALHDPLTELPNRAQLVERLTSALDRGKHHHTPTALLFVDLDRFKNVNDTMGHDAGDRLLVEVADRLRGVVRSGDMVARLGSDEFVVIAEALRDRDEALHMAERLRVAIALPVDLPPGTVTVSASVGIAFDSDHRPGTLLRDADMALHKAKARGRDTVEVFDDSLRAETMRRMAAEQLLRRALDEDGLRVLYQPIVDLGTGEVVAAEALLRILGPGGELLSPTPFIEIGEDSGLIVPVGAGVLDAACAQLAAWRSELGPLAPQSVSVNLSARQITTRAYATVVERTLDRHGVEPSSLTLELTETALIEAGQAAVDTLTALRALGVRLAIDDFGTGYSSLSYLKRFPVDIVKVDRSFVSGLGTQPHDMEIVRAVLALSQSLQLVTVAEGVETEDQLGLLRSMGCDCAQGFLLARPTAGDAMGPAIERIGELGALRRSTRNLRVAVE